MGNWLKMDDGAEVKTIEELREHFDFASVFGYYVDGKLMQWLKNGYYYKEVEQLEGVIPSSKDFKENICRILGVFELEDEVEQIDFNSVLKKNERREQLKKYIIGKRINELEVDQIAFTQEELLELLDNGINVIYLCEGQFILPGKIGGITYIGIHNPYVKFDGEIVESGIVLQDLVCDLSNYIGDGNSIADVEKFYECFKNTSSLGVEQLRIAAEKGDVPAQAVLGVCCLEDFGIDESKKHDEKWSGWLERAAESGNVMAQTILGKWCINTTFFFTAVFRDNIKKAYKWYKKAAEQGYAEAQIGLGNVISLHDKHMDTEEAFEESMKWYRKAAEQGHAVAQMILGNCFMGGIHDKLEKSPRVSEYLTPGDYSIVDEYPLKIGFVLLPYISGNQKEAIVWYKKAAERGFSEAQLLLGACYMDGLGIEKSARKGLEWIQKAIDQKLVEAEKLLDKHWPKEGGTWYQKAIFMLSHRRYCPFYQRFE